MAISGKNISVTIPYKFVPSFFSDYILVQVKFMWCVKKSRSSF